MGGNVRDVVRIGMATYRNFAWLPQFTAFLRKSAPDLGIELAAGIEAADTEALKGQLIDVFITPHDNAAQTNRTELFADELVALVAPSHRLAGRHSITPADVESEVFYTYSLSVQPGFEYLEFLQPARADPVRYVLVPSPETAAAAVRGGQGMTILSRWSVRAELEDKRLIALSLGQRGVKIHWGALVRAGDDKRSAAREVAEQLRAFFAPPPMPRRARS